MTIVKEASLYIESAMHESKAFLQSECKRCNACNSHCMHDEDALTFTSSPLHTGHTNRTSHSPASSRSICTYPTVWPESSQ